MDRIISFLIAFFFCAYIAAEDGVDDIHWYQYNIPPYHFQEGPMQGSGIADPVVDLIRQAMPHAKHKFSTVNIPRMITVQQNAPEDTCIVATFLLEQYRQDWLLSKPLFRESSPMLAMKRITWESLSQPLELRMEDLITNTNLIFGRAANQYISPKLDTLIQQHTDSNLVLVSKLQTSVSLHRMLAANRVDYIITYAAEAGWLKETEFEEEYDDLVLVKISDLEGQPPLVYTACSNNEYGAKIINTMNQALTPSVIARIRWQYMQWLPDENSRIEFMALQLTP